MTAEPTARTLAFVPGIPEALFRLHDVDGSFPVTTARMHTGPWVRGPHGDPSPGVIGVLLDVLLGCPVIAGGPDGCWGVTTTMSAEFCAPIPAHTSYLTGTGEAMYLTETDGISRGSIHTAEGDLIVLGTQHTRFVPALPGRPGPSRRPRHRRRRQIRTRLPRGSGPDRRWRLHAGAGRRTACGQPAGKSARRDRAVPVRDHRVDGHPRSGPSTGTGLDQRRLSAARSRRRNRTFRGTGGSSRANLGGGTHRLPAPGGEGVRGRHGDAAGKAM